MLLLMFTMTYFLLCSMTCGCEGEGPCMGAVVHNKSSEPAVVVQYYGIESQSDFQTAVLSDLRKVVLPGDSVGIYKDVDFDNDEWQQRGMVYKVFVTPLKTFDEYRLETIADKNMYDTCYRYNMPIYTDRFSHVFHVKYYGTTQPIL